MKQFEQEPWRNLKISAQDGLILAARDYGKRLWTTTPIICLPGLSRSVRDFHDLAIYFSQNAIRKRRVVTLEYRGRGQSQFDKNWHNYNVFTELADCLAVIDATGIHKAIFIGTSRGGILTMLMAVTRPSAITAAILVDIGPVINPQGLIAIKRYLNTMPKRTSWEQAAEILKDIQAPHFTNFTKDDWMHQARLTFRDDNGQAAIDFDTNLLHILEQFDTDKAPPTLWPQFEALRHYPVLALRGENSNILSSHTVKEMERRHNSMQSLIIENQGHAPVLSQEIAEKINHFIEMQI